jgi:hypothetical protein
MIRDDFKPYFDGTGLLAPQPNPGLIGSDNGPMFLSEYYIMLKRLGELTEQDKKDYHSKISYCLNANWTLNRVMYPHKASQEGPDDYLGVLNGCKQLGITDIPRMILFAFIRYFGFLNNVEMGKCSKESFFLRQPQLVAAMVAASFPLYTFPHLLLRLIFFPFFAWTALVIAISCINAPQSDTDARRLSWHLVQITKDVSLLCNLASKLWLKRLFKDYGSSGMNAVAAIYYQPQGANPYSRHWVT